MRFTRSECRTRYVRSKDYSAPLTLCGEQGLHLFDLCLLSVDNPLSQLERSGILAFLELGLGHLNCAFVMSNHEFEVELIEFSPSRL